MKTVLLTALTMLLLLPCAKAQTVFKKAQKPQSTIYSEQGGALNGKIKPYLRGGLSVGSFVGENSNGLGNVCGGMVEGGLQIPFNNPQYGIQPGLRFIMKGAKAPWNEGDSNNTTLRLNYLEVPVNFFFKLPAGDKSLLHFALGLYAAYAVSGNQKYQGTSYEVFNGEYFNYHRFDTGADVEIGYQYRRVQFNIGAEVGFVALRSKDSDGNNFPENGAIYFTIGYVFN